MTDISSDPTLTPAPAQTYDAASRGGNAIVGDAARALLGLWRVQGDSLRRHLDRAATPALLHEQVTADVRRAGRLIDTGLQGFAPA